MKQTPIDSVGHLEAEFLIMPEQQQQQKREKEIFHRIPQFSHVYSTYNTIPANHSQTILSQYKWVLINHRFIITSSNTF